MADIEYVIGAKDKATPVVDKVDASLGKLQRSTKATGEVAEKSMQKVDVSFASLAKGAGLVAVANLAVDALRNGIGRLIGSIGSANAAYDTQTESVKGLETSLRLSGEAVEQQSPKLQAFAADMQKLTGVGDEVTLGLMRQASMLGINADQLDDASAAAIGLSEATGKSLDESLKLVKNSLQGEFGALGEVIPAIRQAATEEEKLAMVQALAAKGLDAKTESADRLSGMNERAAGAVGDLMESVGAILAPIRMLIASGTKVLAESLQTALVPAVQMAEKVLANIGPIMDWVKEKIVSAVNGGIKAFTFLEVVVTNLGPVWEMMKASAELQLIRMIETVKHTFTVAIPGYVAWFGDNFTNIITDIFTGAVTIVQNRVTQMADIAARGWEFIASGGKGGISKFMSDIAGIASRSLLEGFEATTESLPDIAARKITEREKELQEKIGQIGSDLGKEFTEKFNARAIGLGESVGDDLQKEIDLKLSAKLGDGAGGGGSGVAKLQAVESRLLTRGPAEKQENFLMQIANNTRETKAEIEALRAERASDEAERRNAESDNPTLVLSEVG